MRQFIASMILVVAGMFASQASANEESLNTIVGFGDESSSLPLPVGNHEQGEPYFPKLKFTREDAVGCGRYDVYAWGIARHLKTTHRFNERNPGVGIRYHLCSLPDGLYALAFRVKNSLSGVTYGFGIGYENEIIRQSAFGTRLTVNAGIDTSYLDYGVPRMCSNKGICREAFQVTGTLPMPFIRIGTPAVGITLHKLVPNKPIYLFGLLYRQEY